MKVVAFLPIKLNSQRLPHKNILPIAGHPLCWHLPNTLVKVQGIDEVYVYCSDSSVKEYLPEQVKFKQRSKELDGDLVKGFDIYKNFIAEIDADIYVLAHTTSPFIKQESIENALKHVISGNNDSAFSAERIRPNRPETIAAAPTTPFRLRDSPNRFPEWARKVSASG